MKKRNDIRITICFNRKYWQQIADDAKFMKIKPNKLVKMRAITDVADSLAYERAIRPQNFDKSNIQLLSRIGTNCNQIARALNTILKYDLDGMQIKNMFEKIVMLQTEIEWYFEKLLTMDKKDWL